METTQPLVSDDAQALEAWYAFPAPAVTQQLDVNPERGLSEGQAAQRLATAGPNRLEEEEDEPFWEELLEELREPLILLLVGTGVLYALWGELFDALVIFAVILTVAGVEILNESRARRAIAALRELAEPTTTVLRDGELRELAVEKLVPGDIIRLEAGRRVPADARLLTAASLAVDESPLTGESVPVDKLADLTLPRATPLAERHNMLYTGTVVTRGRGRAVVVATAWATELGQIAEAARRVKPPRTPLQVAMEQLSHSLVWVALGLSVIVPLLAWLLGGQPLRQMILTGLSLAFATIPEEMPIIITMVLALGGYRLSRRHAIVKQLRAVETLGAITVIATDKTGTLTENQMEVSTFYPASARDRLLEIGVLVNNASPGSVGDPLESALLRAAEAAGMDVNQVRHAFPLQVEFPFDSDRKMMTAVYEREGTLWVGSKGAPEAIIARAHHSCLKDSVQTLGEAERQALLEQAAQLAAAGLRVLALAEKCMPAGPLARERAESNLTLVGLVGLADPPRPAVPAALAEAQAAGIRSLMITGDHPLTAAAIARAVGLNGAGRVLTGSELADLPDDALRDVVKEVSVYARTTPADKLRLVRALHADGFTIGAHTVRHAKLATLSDAEIESEIVTSAREVQAITGQERVTLSFPYSGNGLSRKLLADIHQRHPWLGLFYDTQDLQRDVPFIVQRIWAEKAAFREAGQAINVPALLRDAYEQELYDVARRGPG
ncbi:MAG TPA: hypothetical protein DEP84_37985, partial [Chloroflexi bacterium]|nr:hypothetical protein [Chloroflexota bacterium]